MSQNFSTVKQLAAQLGVSEARVRELVRLGILPHIKLGRQIRFSTTQLDSWIAQGGKAFPGGWRKSA